MRHGAGGRPSHGTRGLVRGAMLVGWCLVLWGSVIVLGALWALVSRGGRPALDAFTRLSPVNQVLAGAALVVWTLAAWAVLDARGRRSGASG